MLRGCFLKWSIMHEEKLSWHAPLLAVALSVGVAAALAAAQFKPPERGMVALVFPPETSTQAMFGAITEAGGVPVRFGGFSNVIVAYTEAPQFANRAKSAGAWLALDPLAEGTCLNPQRPTKVSL